MIERILTLETRDSHFLFGARGTGKTTLLHSLFSDGRALFIDLLDPSEEDSLSRQPSLLEERVLALPDAVSTIVIDEVQKAPRLLNVVHRLIESRKFVFILTGSSSRKLKRGASNLLAGRAFVQTLHPFTSLELGERFDLPDALQWGTLPAISHLDSDARKQNYLRSYALTYLKEEIQEEQILRKLDPFRQFLEIAAQSNGRIINYSKIAQDVGVDTGTVISYFSILQDTLVGYIIPAYHESVRKRQRKNPKFYFFDTGVKRALERTLTVKLVERTYAFGDAFEHFVVLEILRLSQYLFPDWQTSYLSAPSGAEIDLIIDRPGQSTVLLEIKSTDSVTDRDVKTLNRFAPDFPGCEALCFSRDKTRKRMDNVLCLHWQDGLRELGFQNTG